MDTDSSPNAPDEADAPLSEDAAYYRRVLHRAIDVGVVVLGCIETEAQAPRVDTAPAAELAMAYERVARALRRNIAQAQRLAEAARSTHHREAARRRIIRAVEDAIQRETTGRTEESLREELFERLDGPDVDADIDDDRPIEAIIMDIRRDLGIDGTHRYRRRTPWDIAELWERAAGSVQSAPSDGDPPWTPAGPGASPQDNARWPGS